MAQCETQRELALAQQAFGLVFDDHVCSLIGMVV
jgi:hypothetical protein